MTDEDICKILKIVAEFEEMPNRILSSMNRLNEEKGITKECVKAFVKLSDAIKEFEKEINQESWR